ncbi:MAG: class I SAM-dependent methyltransferase [Thermotogae bacterium]|nr:class I SAM-dependent methyltransferase [Thermotogota bacterium]
MNRFVITTSYKPNHQQVVMAKKIANELSYKYVPRKKLKKDDLDFFYVVEKNGRLVIRGKNLEFFFHPSIAKVRFLNIKKGLKDYLIEALEPLGNETVLDLTFGLGSEAILMANFLPNGKVIGVEGSIHIYTVVKYGLRTYRDRSDWINEAMKRIDLWYGNFKELIKGLPNDSVDVVYCDPMFENPIFESNSMNPLRKFAVYDSIDTFDVEHMIRIAKKKVILKSRVGDTMFEKIKVDKLLKGKNSVIIYGVIFKN